MDFSLKQKLLIVGVILLIAIIPITSFVISTRFRAQNNATASVDQSLKKRSQDASSSAQEVPKTSPLQELQKNLGQDPKPTNKDDVGETVPTSTISFGPTLKFKLLIEGHPPSNQSTKLFLGMALGQPVNNINYLLSFTLNVPETGASDSVSLAGLTSGETYSAVFKGASQLATAATFSLKPTVNDVGSIELVSGDLNDDNVINTSDLSLARNAYGTTSISENWYPLADLNLDGVINNIDLGLIIKNIGRVGDTGAWISTPTASSSSASLIKTPVSIGKPLEAATTSSTTKNSAKPAGIGGYWLWVPPID